MGKKIKIDKKKLEQLLKDNEAFRKRIEELGLTVNQLDAIIERLEAMSPQNLQKMFDAAYDEFRDKYFYHEPCPPGKMWSWETYDCMDSVIVEPPPTPPPVQCPEGQHFDIAIGKCVPDVITEPPGQVEGKDKWNIPFFHKSKPNGLFYEMSDDPKNDQYLEELDDHYTVSNGVITMKPDGPTSIGVGKYIRTFENDIGPANMKHSELEQKGYMYKQDDVRDLEYKAVIRIKGIGEHGLSISSTTGRHSEDPDCRGFAYMFNVEDPSATPTTFRFRKEQWHVHYVNSPEGIWTNKDVVPMALDGADWFGYGFCRYNSQDNKKVYLEAWICPPGKDVTVRDNWKLLKRVEDFNGHGWGDQGQKCGGVKDQFGPWSGPQNRLKTNATSGTVEFKCISFREIDPADAVTQ